MAADFFDRVRTFYDKNRQGLLTYALSLADDYGLAEDAVQAAIFGLLRRGRIPKDMRPFVFRSVRNAVFDGRRRGNRRQSGTEPVLEATAESHPVRDRTIQQCLLRLGDPERESIVLKVFGGLTFAEIASVEGSSVSTVASRYRRGLEKMRTMLDGES